jgi:hypothetical protein
MAGGASFHRDASLLDPAHRQNRGQPPTKRAAALQGPTGIPQGLSKSSCLAQLLYQPGSFPHFNGCHLWLTTQYGTRDDKRLIIVIAFDRQPLADMTFPIENEASISDQDQTLEKVERT